MKKLDVYGAGLLVILVLAVLVATGRCSVGKHKNSLGVVMENDNPMTYKAGNITAVAYVEEGKGIVLRIQPIGTYSLFTEDLLMCYDDNVLPMLLNKGNPMVLTYRTKASRLVGGLGCHRLMHVDALQQEALP